MSSEIAFILDNQIHRISFDSTNSVSPTTTLLNYLRSLPDHKGTKEGCAEGDCGACTVVIASPDKSNRLRYRAVNSCLLFLPMLNGKQVITVENLAFSENELHPVQQALVDHYGSQCGFCTPGIVMSLYALYLNNSRPSGTEIAEALAGNLCRCTGYLPILEISGDVNLDHQEDPVLSREPETSRLLKTIKNESLTLEKNGERYFRPANLSEALKLISEYPDAHLFCGATDLALRVTKDFEILPAVIDLGAVSELQKIEENSGSVEIGAGAPLSEVAEVTATHFPALKDILDFYGSVQIRNLATLGGNLGTASPIGDSLPVLIALNATVALESLNGRREIPLDDFFTGYRQSVRKKDEIITAIRIPKQYNGALIKSYKISKRHDVDISTLSAGFRLELDEKSTVNTIKLAYGGMAVSVRRALQTEKFLTGKLWNRDNVETAAELLKKDFAPISDVRGSAGFRKISASNLLLKFWTETFRPEKITG